VNTDAPPSKLSTVYARHILLGNARITGSCNRNRTGCGARALGGWPTSPPRVPFHPDVRLPTRICSASQAATALQPLARQPHSNCKAVAHAQPTLSPLPKPTQPTPPELCGRVGAGRPCGSQAGGALRTAGRQAYAQLAADWVLDLCVVPPSPAAFPAHTHARLTFRCTLSYTCNGYAASCRGALRSACAPRRAGVGWDGVGWGADESTEAARTKGR